MSSGLVGVKSLAILQNKSPILITSQSSWPIVRFRIMQRARKNFPELWEKHFTFLRPFEENERKGPCASRRRLSLGFWYPEGQRYITTVTFIADTEWTLHLSHRCIWKKSRMYFSIEPEWREHATTDRILVSNPNQTRKKPRYYTLRMSRSKLGRSVIKPIHRSR